MQKIIIKLVGFFFFNFIFLQIVDPWGTVIAQCSQGIGLQIASIDFDFINRVRADMPLEDHRRTDIYPKMESYC